METIQITDTPYEAVVKGLLLVLTAPTPEKADDAMSIVVQLANSYLTGHQWGAAKRDAEQRFSLEGYCHACGEFSPE